MSLKLDIHLNLGQIPETKKRTPLHVSPQQMIDYIIKYNLSHAVILYKDIEEYREVRNNVLQTVKLYPLKWITDVDVEVKQLQEEEAVGVCVHSHRGTVDESIYGLDYAGRPIHKIFKNLPENFIVCVHTQGVNSYRNISRAMSVVKWAAKYPHLKFLIEHTGSYLRKEFYPSVKSWDDLQEGNGHVPAFLQDAIGSESCIQEALLASKKMHNIFCDSSIVSAKNYKAKLLDQSKDWAFGSDWPFENDLCSVDKQVKIFQKHYNYTDEDIQAIHQRGVDFLEKSARQLFEEQDWQSNKY